jgi:hypothetical protein
VQPQRTLADWRAGLVDTPREILTVWLRAGKPDPHCLSIPAKWLLSYADWSRVQARVVIRGVELRVTMIRA